MDVLELLLSLPNISSLSNLQNLKDQNNGSPICFLKAFMSNFVKACF